MTTLVATPNNRCRKVRIAESISWRYRRNPVFTMLVRRLLKSFLSVQRDGYKPVRHAACHRRKRRLEQESTEDNRVAAQRVWLSVISVPFCSTIPKTRALAGNGQVIWNRSQQRITELPRRESGSPFSLFPSVQRFLKLGASAGNGQVIWNRSQQRITELPPRESGSP